jgi:hypothetical protein
VTWRPGRQRRVATQRPGARCWLASADVTRRDLATIRELTARTFAVAAGVSVALGSQVGAAVLSVPTSEPSQTPTAHAFGGEKTVGALFPPGSSTHVCTASVVSSPARDLLLTAAHCVSGTGRGYLFDPGFRDGVAPFGSWKVIDAYAPKGWLAHQSPKQDFVFLVVAPRRRNGREVLIQTVTGANRIATSPAPGDGVTVPAYPAGQGGDPITCTTSTYVLGTYPAFNCTPYVGGTSGAPWLHRSGSGWTVVGIIGGLDQGGCFPWTSYSPVFGKPLRRAMAAAITRGPPSTLPAPVPPDCPS